MEANQSPDYIETDGVFTSSVNISCGYSSITAIALTGEPSAFSTFSGKH